jgi:hypothetical protein
MKIRLGWPLVTAAALTLPAHAAEPVAPPPTLTPLAVAKVGKNAYLLREPLVMSFKDGAPAIVVPAGFITELASVPKRLQWWNAKTAAASIAPAMIHDYLYWTQPCTRDEADAVLHAAMRAAGRDAAKANAVYQAVSRTGAATYKDNLDKRRNGEVRTFTAEYAGIVAKSDPDANETLASAVRKAQSSAGLVKKESASEAIRLTCARLLYQCTVCRDHVARKGRAG